MKRKLLSIALCTAMVVSMMAGCGNTNDSQGSTTQESDTQTPSGQDASDETGNGAADQEVSDAPVTISIGFWPTEDDENTTKMYEGFVETMADLHPNVTVEPATYAYSVDTFMPMVEAGTVPTIFGTWFTEPQKLIANKAVADITDELEARGWIDKMNPSIRELVSDENGRVYGVPHGTYALGLMINAALFREAGLVDAEGYPIVPTTWDELAETAKTIKDATGAAGLCLLAADNSGGWHFSNIAWGFGATLCVDNGDGTYTAQLDSEEAIAAMEYVRSLKWDYDVLTADPMSENWGTGFTQLGTGAAAMYIAANDAVNRPTQTNGLPLEDLCLAALPAGPAGQYSLLGGAPYMFSKDATSEEINAALDFLEIVGEGPDVSDELVAGLQASAQTKVANGVPVIQEFPSWISQDRTDAWNSILEEYGNIDPKMYESYFNATSASGLRPEEPGSTQDMYAELTKVIQAVLTDENADIPALMKTANDNYQSILDNN